MHTPGIINRVGSRYMDFFFKDMYFEIGEPYNMILTRSTVSSLDYGGIVSQWCGINGVEPNELNIGSRIRFYYLLSKFYPMKI